MEPGNWSFHPHIYYGAPRTKDDPAWKSFSVTPPTGLLIALPTMFQWLQNSWAHLGDAHLGNKTCPK